MIMCILAIFEPGMADQQSVKQIYNLFTEQSDKQTTNFLGLFRLPGVFILFMHCCVTCIAFTYLEPVLGPFMEETVSILPSYLFYDCEMSTKRTVPVDIYVTIRWTSLRSLFLRSSYRYIIYYHMAFICLVTFARMY